MVETTDAPHNLGLAGESVGSERPTDGGQLARASNFRRQGIQRGSLPGQQGDSYTETGSMGDRQLARWRGGRPILGPDPRRRCQVEGPPKRPATFSTATQKSLSERTIS